MTLNQQERALLQIALDALSALATTTPPAEAPRCRKCGSEALDRIATAGSGDFIVCLQCGNEWPAEDQLVRLQEGGADAEVSGA